MKHKIAILGSYGGMNLGDEAILASILKQIRSSLKEVEIVVFSRNPKDTEFRHKLRAVHFDQMHKDDVQKELEKLDLFILGGGGILFDGMAEKFLRHVQWAKDLNIPVLVYAISVGPLKNAETKRLVVDTLNRVEKITVRENEAKKMLHDLGVDKEVEVTADPALLLEEEPFTDEMLTKEGIESGKKLVGFSLREPGPAAPDLNIDHYHSVLANVADFMIERFDAHIIFVPMESGENRDPQHSHAVISKMANVQKAAVLKGAYTSPQILGLMKHMSFAVGMRLHFLIFAGIQRVPFVPLPYASKISGFLSELELPMPDIMKLNIGKLCASLDRSWDTRQGIVKKLEEKIPMLQEKARRTNQILEEILGSLKASKTVESL